MRKDINICWIISIIFYFQYVESDYIIYLFCIHFAMIFSVFLTHDGLRLTKQIVWTVHSDYIIRLSSAALHYVYFNILVIKRVTMRLFSLYLIYCFRCEPNGINCMFQFRVQKVDDRKRVNLLSFGDFKLLAHEAVNIYFNKRYK